MSKRATARPDLHEAITRHQAQYPWVVPNLPRFIQAVVSRMANQPEADPKVPCFKLKVYPVPGQEPNLLYEATWVGRDGKLHVEKARNWEPLWLKVFEVETALTSSPNE